MQTSRSILVVQIHDQIYSLNWLLRDKVIVLIKPTFLRLTYQCPGLEFIWYRQWTPSIGTEEPCMALATSRACHHATIHWIVFLLYILYFIFYDTNTQIVLFSETYLACSVTKALLLKLTNVNYSKWYYIAKNDNIANDII